MIFEKFNHSVPGELHDKELSLHDCISDHVIYEENTLRFCLPEGFWITPGHAENHCGQTVRTDKAAVDFYVEDINDIMLCVFIKKRLGFSKKTVLEYWDMKKFISDVNNGRYSIEFIYQYTSPHEQLWQCIIHSNKNSDYMECQLHIPNTTATFYWNNLRPERKW